MTGRVASAAVLLAFDTATPAVTVALHDGERVVAAAHRRRRAAPRRAARPRRSPPCSTRPGCPARTSPRSPSASARARSPGCASAWSPRARWAWPSTIPVYGVCTLDVLAAQAVDEGAVAEPFLVATDARRKEVYWASYDERGPAARRAARVDRPADVATDGPRRRGRRAALPRGVPARGVGPEHPDAGVLAQVVTDERAELLDPEPLYLRRPDAAAPGTPKPVS